MRPRHGLAFVLPWAVSSCALVVGFPDRELALEAGTDGRGTDTSDRADGTGSVDGASEGASKADARIDARLDAGAMDTGHAEADAPRPADGGHDSKVDAPADASSSKDAAARFCLQAVSVPGPDAGLARAFCDDFEEGDASLAGQWDTVENVSLTTPGSNGTGHSLVANVTQDASSLIPQLVRNLDGGTNPSSQSIEVDFDIKDVDAPGENGLLLTIDVGTYLLWFFDGHQGTPLQLQEHAGSGGASGALPSGPPWTPAPTTWVHIRVRLDIVDGGTSMAYVWVGPTSSPYSLQLDGAWKPGPPQITLGVSVTPFSTQQTSLARVLYDNVEVFESN